LGNDSIQVTKESVEDAVVSKGRHPNQRS